MGIVRFDLGGGLKTDLSEEGPDFSESCVNWFRHSGMLKKRGGEMPIRTYGMPYENGSVFASVLAKTYTCDTSGNLSGAMGAPSWSSSSYDIVIVAAAKFNRAAISGTIYPNASFPLGYTEGGFQVSPQLLNGTTEFPSSSALYFPRQIATYWNGSSWQPLRMRDITQSVKNTSDDTCLSGMFWATGSDHTIALDGTLAQIVFDPPSDWTSKTDAVTGVSGYMVRIKLYTPSGTGAVQAPVPHYLDTNVGIGNNAVIGMISYVDRYGEKHVVSAHVQADAESHYAGDEVSAIIFEDSGNTIHPISPGDWSQAPAPGAGVINENTKCMMVYHSATDRVIAYVDGAGWFYMPGNGKFYSLYADSSGEDTDYASVPGGLRGSMPDADNIAVADSRVFVSRGQSIMWSGYGIYPDVWPNRNELFIDDGLGPITGIQVMNGVIYVFKSRAIYSLQPNGKDDGDGYDAVPVSNTIGAVGGFAPAGATMFFVGHGGFYMFDGSSPRKISSRVDEAFFTNVIGSDLSKCRGLYYSPLNQVRYYFPSIGESNIIDRAIYIDVGNLVSKGEDNSNLSIWPQGKYSSDEAGWRGTSVLLDSTVQPPRVLLGDKYGVVWQMDSSMLGTDGAPVIADLVQVTQNTNRMDHMLVSHPSVGLMTNGATPKISIICDGNETGQVTLSSTPTDQDSRAAAMNADNAWIDYGTDSLKFPSAIRKRRANFSRRCEEFKIRIHDESLQACEISGVEIDVVAQGRRGQR